jgi:hypothetical protein
LPPYARKSFYDFETFDPFEKEENKLFPITLFLAISLMRKMPDC